MHHRFSRWALCILALGLPGSVLAESKFNKVLTVGQVAPAWGPFESVDGRKRSLADFEKAKVIVLVFTCNHCPVAKKYEARLLALVRKYDPRDVQVVAISVSRHAADGLDRMKKRAAENKLPWPWMYDGTQSVGKAYGATATPHFFVLDAKRRVMYMGAFDDNFEPEEVTMRYVPDAVETLLAGKEPAVKETLQRGCGIEYGD